ncbi:hypothetical protein IPM44_03815 [bacterium]|nr:MAG: hypothetical protein IPM44_03815 [bacterium]
MFSNVLYIFSIVAIGVLGLIVILANSKGYQNRLLACFNFSASLWLLTNFLASIATRDTSALLWSRLAVIPAVLSASFFLLLSLSFQPSPKKRPWLIVALAVASLSFTFLAPTNLNATSITAGQNNLVVGPLYIPLLAYLLLCVGGGLIVLGTSYRKARGMLRQQILYVFTGIILAFVPVIFTNAVAILFGINSFLDTGPSFVLIFVAFSSFAIVRHRLLNIRAVVARSLAYVFSIGAFSLIYAFLAFGLAQGVLLKNVLTTQLSRQIFNVVLAVVLAFTFPTIRRFFEKITDRVFYRDRYDPQKLVSDIGRVLASEILLEKLSAKVLKILDAQIHLANSNIVVMGEDGIFYQTHANKIQQLYHAPELTRFNKGVTLVDEVVDAQKRDILDRHNVRAVFPLRTREAFVGYLLLGEKQSGDIFSSQDVQTLQIISDELAIAINNARSYQEIQGFNETLREKVRQATAELRHANAELKELDKAKDEFISMASHQLRTPLTAVRGYTSMVMDGDFGRVSKEQKETLKQSFDAATRMTRLVDDLLNVSRIQSGKFKIERTDVDLNKVLPEEISMLATAAEMKHVVINFHVPKEPVPILQIDEGKTRQCLMNLMDNAIYYSSTARDGGKVDVYLEANAGWVSFRVVDNGIGVPKAEQAKLFQKFYRAPNAQKTRPDGTGLGLFLVGRVTKDQGGEVIFESEEGKGSTFGFKLPVKAAGEDLTGAVGDEAATE